MEERHLLRWKEMNVVSVEDFRDLSHVRLPIGRKRAQLFKELLKVCAGQDGPKSPAGIPPDVAERVRNVPREMNHGIGRDLLNLLIELNFKFTIENAKELIFMTMHMQRHTGARRR